MNSWYGSYHAISMWSLNQISWIADFCFGCTYYFEQSASSVIRSHIERYIEFWLSLRMSNILTGGHLIIHHFGRFSFGFLGLCRWYAFSHHRRPQSINANIFDHLLTYRINYVHIFPNMFNRYVCAMFCRLYAPSALFSGISSNKLFASIEIHIDRI